jgi:hypothetical protein
VPYPLKSGISGPPLNSDVAAKMQIADMHAKLGLQTANELLEAWDNAPSAYRKRDFRISVGLVRQVERLEFIAAILQNLRRLQAAPMAAPYERTAVGSWASTALVMLVLAAAVAWLLARNQRVFTVAERAMRLLGPLLIGAALSALGWL